MVQILAISEDISRVIKMHSNVEYSVANFNFWAFNVVVDSRAMLITDISSILMKIQHFF